MKTETSEDYLLKTSLWWHGRWKTAADGGMCAPKFHMDSALPVQILTATENQLKERTVPLQRAMLNILTFYIKQTTSYFRMLCLPSLCLFAVLDKERKTSSPTLTFCTITSTSTQSATFIRQAEIGESPHHDSTCSQKTTCVSEQAIQKFDSCLFWSFICHGSPTTCVSSDFTLWENRREKNVVGHLGSLLGRKLGYNCK